MRKRIHYEDWQEAAEASAGKKAYARWRPEKDRRGNTVPTEIVKPLIGDGYIRYRTADIPIRKATTSEIDSVKIWRPY